MNKRATGIQGEEEATKYLKKQGYGIVAKNVKIAGVEVDIIAKTGNTLVFVEVKCRSGLGYGRGVESVDKRRQKRYVRAAKAFTAIPTYALSDVRFDVVEVLGDSVLHIEDAFQG